MTLCASQHSKGTLTQILICVSMFSQMSEVLLCKASVYIVRLFYHEAKMFARKDIFAKPSSAQSMQGMGGTAAKAYAVRLSAFIITYLQLLNQYSNKKTFFKYKKSIHYN